MADHVGPALGTGLGGVEEFGGLRVALFEEIADHEDGGEGVVEVMRDTAGEGADAFQTLGAALLALALEALSDVAGDGDAAALAFLGGDDLEADLDRELAAAAGAVLGGDAADGLLSGQEGLEETAQTGLIIFGQNIQGGHAEELLAVILELTSGSLIDKDEGQGLGLEDEGAVIGGIEHGQSLADLAFRLHALGDVPHGGDDLGAVVRLHGAEADVHVEDGAIALAAFEIGAADAHGAGDGGGEVLLAQADVAPAGLLLHEDLHGLANEFVTLVAEELLGLAVDEGDEAFGIGHDHGVRRALEEVLELLAIPLGPPLCLAHGGDVLVGDGDVDGTVVLEAGGFAEEVPFLVLIGAAELDAGLGKLADQDAAHLIEGVAGGFTAAGGDFFAEIEVVVPRAACRPGKHSLIFRLTPGLVGDDDDAVSIENG